MIFGAEILGEKLDQQTGALKSGSNCVRTKPGTFLEMEDWAKGDGR